jgi:ribonuclease D
MTLSFVVDDREQLLALLPALLAAPVLAVDVESNGLFVYRPRLCTVQIAWQTTAEAGADGGDASGRTTHAAIIDTQAVDAVLLAPVLGAMGPVKLLHDLAFDGRLLFENGVVLGNVRDTSVAARFLGRKNLGLGNLLTAELGITVDKGLQHHDWSRRPITDAQRAYLENDVVHLFALDERLQTEAQERGLEGYVAAETEYKLSESIKIQTPHAAPHLRMKGAMDLPRDRLPLLRRLFRVREQLAGEDDVPAFKVVPPDVLIALAKEAPPDGPRLSRFLNGRAGTAHARGLFHQAIEAGRNDKELDEEERAVVERKPPPPLERQERKRREERLRAFRRREAEARGIDEQAILPGHCASALTDQLPRTLDELRQIRGLGECRIEEFGATLLELLILDVEPEDIEPGAS